MAIVFGLKKPDFWPKVTFFLLNVLTCTLYTRLAEREVARKGLAAGASSLSAVFQNTSQAHLCALLLIASYLGRK